MRTLIVLCAGGQRINDIPLYLCRHPEGELIVKKVLEGVYPESYDKIVYAILEEEDEKHHASKIIKEISPEGIAFQIVKLPHISNGPAETVYLTIKQADICGEIIIRDSLGEMKLTSVPYGNFIVGLDMLDYNDSIQRMKSKGFIIVNEQNIVLDFMEKRFSSDIISVGLYGFRSAEQFCTSFEKLSDSSYNIQRLSVGHVISFMIGYYGRKFYLYYSNQFEDWGDTVAWYAMQKRHATVFIDFDELMNGEDIDNLSHETLVSLRILSDRGIHCIFYCSNKNSYDYQKIQEFCKTNGINCEEVICRQSCSQEKYFINNVSDIERLMYGV